jgi:alpha/beta superfamily hydrolase
MGTSDQWTSLSTFDGWVETLPEPKEKSIIDGADHFFFGQEHKIVKEVETWLQKF